jgi:CRP-like cAMP-binding protein
LNKTTLNFKHRNLLLSKLSQDDALRWSEVIKIIPLEKNQVLFEPNQSLNFVYFPVACVLSIQHDFEDGSTMGYAYVGNEGLVGMQAFMGERRCSSTAVVMTPGLAYRVPMAWIENEFNTSASFRRLLMLYLQTLLMSTSQNVICNRKHSIEQQLARTLLWIHDKVGGNTLQVTHKDLSMLLGVRREGVSLVAKLFQSLGLIAYRRGEIKVLNRSAIEHAACECYGLVSRQYVRLMSNTGSSSLFSGPFYKEPTG